ncbi:hypothetical protein [Aminobacter sp. HY435]|uniref:hypothetical protein n=1 Tax=Aminobacter sp. HY435 TaxID=2970917 RepID=UPI0022B9879E|nr:hypothetical protein [Aminobacter sp. HY435]
MRLVVAVVVAGIAGSGATHASSIVELGDSAASPSAIIAGAGQWDPTSIIELGAPAIDSGKVAAVGAKMGPEPMVMRGGEIGHAAADPVVATPPAPGSPATPEAADTQGEQAPVATE